MRANHYSKRAKETQRALTIMLNGLYHRVRANTAGIIPYSHLGRIREGGRELKEGNYEESDVLRVAMPRGSVYVLAIQRDAHQMDC